MHSYLVSQLLATGTARCSRTQSSRARRGSSLHCASHHGEPDRAEQRIAGRTARWLRADLEP